MKEIMKNKMILGLSAMILASCATTQHKQDINKNINSHIEATKNTNDMDNDYLILSDGQHAQTCASFFCYSIFSIVTWGQNSSIWVSLVF